jgi:cytochrome c oxidase cbb3-type subunit 3
VRRIVALFLGPVLTLFATMAGSTPAQDTHETFDREMSKPIIRGGIVFRSYCILCHGDRGDGAARAAKLYAGLNLTIRPRPVAYYEKIIRQGGEGVGAAPSMPPWQDELSDEQIQDVVTFLTVLGDPVRRGEVVFKTNCVLCHGVHGDGRGRAAKLYDPPPTDLTGSERTDGYKEKIIRLGGEALRRSSVMPPWAARLSNSEITDLIAYLRAIVVPPHAP